MTNMTEPLKKYFLVWSKSTGRYRRLEQLLISAGWSVGVCEDFSDLDSSEKEESTICLAILEPRQPLNDTDTKLLIDFHKKHPNRHLLIAQGTFDHPRREISTQLNNFLVAFGIELEPKTCVIRANPFNLYHPKEAVLEDFVSNRALVDLIRVQQPATHNHVDTEKLDGSRHEISEREDLDGKQQGLQVVYPKGCSLKVDTRRSTVLMCSSSWCLPSNQAICALHESTDVAQIHPDGSGPNRLLVIGSAGLLSDQWFDELYNGILVRILLLDILLAGNKFSVNVSDARTIEIPRNNMSADTVALSSIPIACLEPSYEPPENRLQLLDLSLFSLEWVHLPRVLEAYEHLNMPESDRSVSLSLIKPALVRLSSSRSDQIDTKRKFVIMREIKSD